MKHLRAVLVLLHVLAITILAFPAPVGAMNRRSFQEPGVQDTIASYARALQAVGAPVDRETLEDWLWRQGSRLIQVRRAAVKPWKPYVALTGAEQGWRMFGTVARRPAWLVVEVQEGGAWRPVYRSRSSTLTWRAHQFDQERMRAVVSQWSWKSRKKGYEEFGVWLARQASVDFPQASHLRTRMEQVVLPPPERLRAEGLPAGRPFWETTYSLDKYR